MNRNDNQNGSSLVGVLAVMVAAAGLSALMVQTTERDSDIYTDLSVSSSKLFAAESALETARWAIQHICSTPPVPPVDIVNDQFEVRFTETPEGSGIYTVTTKVFAAVSGDQQEHRVSRTIVTNGVECRYANPPPPVWLAGITACEWIRASGSSTLSFNSATREGTVARQANIMVLNDGGYVTKTGSGNINGDIILPGSGAYVEFTSSANVNGEIKLTGARGDKGYFKHTGSGDVHGAIRVPGNVILEGSSKVYGDVHVGGTVSLRGSARIFGTTHTGSSTPTSAGACDPYDVTTMIESARPAAASNRGDFRKTGSSDTTWTPGTYFYNSFSMSGSGDLILTKVGDQETFNLFVDGPFQMSGSGQLILANGVTLNIYHTGGSGHTQNFSISGSGSINPTSQFGQTKIYSNTTGTISVSGSNDLAAAIYAPTAAVRISGSGDLYGASHSKTFDITGSGDVMYDRHLGEIDAEDRHDILVEMTDWSENFIP
ncbi:MAG: polymer-forming cytoskeletal protein [Magnetococcales bacterium]|nr:polymer-forming cytoskeletal protein [Magnetococcales bacterium]MBF0630635.1 polymer-forming cytoskeletal protein [Magnetococcales bacterium]